MLIYGWKSTDLLSNSSSLIHTPHTTQPREQIKLSWPFKHQISADSISHTFNGNWKLLTKINAFCHKKSLCYEFKFYNPYIFETCGANILIFSSLGFLIYIKIQCLPYQRFTTSGGKDISFLKSEFVAKTQGLPHTP